MRTRNLTFYQVW